MSKKLPIGIDSFKKLRQEDFYYIDKTQIIKDIITDLAEVTLYTRPRRFGKTLTMTMLQAFFEIGGDAGLFDGLSISRDKVLCEAHMGKYPVVFVTFKDVDGLTYESAYDKLRTLIRAEAFRLGILRGSPSIPDDEKSAYLRIINEKDTTVDIAGSLKMFCSLLKKHYGQNVILLIDEYDVPLDKAWQHGYYRQMVDLMRSMLGFALKSNNDLFFAILTGCLRVSKESIFTGMNNLRVNTILDTDHAAHFGFTGEEVKELLNYYGRADRFEDARAWYDGYHFGHSEMYCPWDVINFAARLRSDPAAEPEPFWINSSGNDIVRSFVDIADRNTQDEIECLINGGTIVKRIRPDLTYADIHANIDNLWSVLFTTGYLTCTEKTADGAYRLRIPNREVREVYILQIREWFKDKYIRDDATARVLCDAFRSGNADAIRKRLDTIMGQLISILDTASPDSRKESFYHGLLLGLLRGGREWRVRSNAESGDGFSDILVETEDPDDGIVIEVKYSPTIAGLDDACSRAMAQIRQKRYDERLRAEGVVNILACGIAFCKKRCRVVCEKLPTV